MSEEMTRNISKEENLLDTVDKTIETVCAAILNEEITSQHYADTVIALAMLIRARTQMD